MPGVREGVENMKTDYKNLNKRDNPDKPLTVEVKNKVLTISIGVSTLAFQVDEASLYPFIQEDANQSPRWRINNNDAFAVDVQRELEREKEDGSTPVTDLLDKVILSAIEQGSMFVDDVNSGPIERLKSKRKGRGGK